MITFHPLVLMGNFFAWGSPSEVKESLVGGELGKSMAIYLSSFFYLVVDCTYLVVSVSCLVIEGSHLLPMQVQYL